MSTHSHKKGSTMLTLQLLILTVLLYDRHTLADKVLAPFETYDFNRSWSIREHVAEDPIPVKDTNGQLIYVPTPGRKGDRDSIKLDFQDQRKSCVVPPTAIDNFVLKHTAQSLGNGKVIVMLATTDDKWGVTIIDPKDCTFHHLTVANTSDSLAKILPYENTFDIVLQNENHDNGLTKIVRYNDIGEVVKTFSSFIADENFLKILVAKEYDPSKGYFYTVPSRQPGVFTLKKLNSEFEVVKSYDLQFFQDSVDAYSAEHGRFSNCYYDESKKSLKCLIVDAELGNILADVRIPCEKEIKYVTVRNLSGGGIMIVYAVQTKNGSNIYVQYVGEDGKIRAPVEFGKFRYSIELISHIYDFEIKDGSYCITIVTRFTIDTKCIVPPALKKVESCYCLADSSRTCFAS